LQLIPFPKTYIETALLFVIAPKDVLPVEQISWEALTVAHHLGIKGGKALKIYQVPVGNSLSLEHLVESGKAEISGHDPFASVRNVFNEINNAELPTEPKAPSPRICDTLIPCFEPETLWLGIYQVSGTKREDAESFAHPAQQLCIEQITCLDKLCLSDVKNDTCWFYPTEDGEYLSWESQHSIAMEPGYLADGCLLDDQHQYERGHLNLLWSLMAKDRDLTCVGLTYMNRRIEWPFQVLDKKRSAIWTSFVANSLAKNSYSELSKITVFSDQVL
jgi:hypothetical protein